LKDMATPSLKKSARQSRTLRGMASKDPTRHERRPEGVLIIQNLTELDEGGTLRSGG